LTIGEPTSLAEQINGRFAAIVTMGRIFDPNMDVHYALSSLDMVNRLVGNNTILLMLLSKKRGNTAKEAIDALGRLGRRIGNLRVFVPSQETIALLCISDGRDGLVNALHRFDNGVLTGQWRAPKDTPHTDHRHGRSEILRAK
jgi:hypothetical protein